MYPEQLILKVKQDVGGYKMSINTYLEGIASNLIIKGSEKDSITVSLDTFKKRMNDYFSKHEVVNLKEIKIFETKKTPREGLVICNEIEALLGRKRNPQALTYENRPIDIDILFYENEIINESDLIIPHPLIEKRDFVLIPLKELIPDYIHPVLNKKINAFRK